MQNKQALKKFLVDISCGLGLEFDEEDLIGHYNDENDVNTGNDVNNAGNESDKRRGDALMSDYEDLDQGYY